MSLRHSLLGLKRYYAKVLSRAQIYQLGSSYMCGSRPYQDAIELDRLIDAIRVRVFRTLSDHCECSCDCLPGLHTLLSYVLCDTLVRLRG